MVTESGERDMLRICLISSFRTFSSFGGGGAPELSTRCIPSQHQTIDHLEECPLTTKSSRRRVGVVNSHTSRTKAYRTGRLRACIFPLTRDRWVQWNSYAASFACLSFPVFDFVIDALLDEQPQPQPQPQRSPSGPSRESGQGGHLPHPRPFHLPAGPGSPRRGRRPV